MIGADDQVPVELRRLHAEAVRFARRVAAPEALRSAYAGTDPTGSVSVTTGPDGLVAEVDVHPDWTGRLSADELADAVLAAVHDAGLRRVGAWTDAIDAPQPEPSAGLAGATRHPHEPGSPPLPELPPPGPPGDMSSPRVQANINELFELISDARAAIDAVGQRLEEWATARISGRSPSGEVTVVLQGNQPVEVAFAPAWLRRAGAGEISRALRHAFAEAYLAHPPLTPDGLAAGSPLAALRDLTADPLALLRRVGLRRDAYPDDEGEARATPY